MTRTNHILTSLLLTETTLALVSPEIFTYEGLASITHNPATVGGMIALFGTCIAGAVFPDLDLKLFRSFGHRTLFHWFPPYAALAVYGYLSEIMIFFMFAVSCLLHIALDSLSRAGIPILTPYGRRWGLRIMYVGGPVDATATFLLPMVLITLPFVLAP